MKSYIFYCKHCPKKEKLQINKPNSFWKYLNNKKKPLSQQTLKYNINRIGTTRIIANFKSEKDSGDVLFLHSSHFANHFLGIKLLFPSFFIAKTSFFSKMTTARVSRSGKVTRQFLPIRDNFIRRLLQLVNTKN